MQKRRHTRGENAVRSGKEHKQKYLVNVDAGN